MVSLSKHSDRHPSTGSGRAVLNLISDLLQKVAKRRFRTSLGYIEAHKSALGLLALPKDLQSLQQFG